MARSYVIVRGAAPAALVRRVGADLDARFAATPFCEGGFYGERTKAFSRLLIRSPLVADLVLNRTILDLSELALGNWCERIQLNLAQAIEIHPGALPQFPHRDQDMWQGALGEVEYLVNMMWPLTSFTADNGATIIWPNSHGVEPLVEEPRVAG
jgi:Protein involved in biosynthesis of mitomycin antibiotics/polyketide fumonisin